MPHIHHQPRRRHRRCTALVIAALLAITAPCAIAQVTAPATAPASAPAQPNTDMLRRRLDIAQREQAQAQRRISEMMEEVESLKNFISPEAYAKLRPEAEVPKPDAPVMPSLLSGDELQRAVTKAEATAKAMNEYLAGLRAAMVAAGPELEKARYKALVEDVAQDVAELRELPLHHPINPIILNKQELSDLLTNLLAEELPEEKLRGEALTWSALGLIPPDADLRMLYSGLLEEQVGGLYNEKNGSLYVVSTFNPNSILGKIILSHEICHALQDQNFPIKSLPFRTDNEDQNMAMSAVLEGDATLLMIEWGSANFKPADLLGITEMFNQGTQQLENVPPAMVQALIFPYMVGAQFVTHLQTLKFDGWRDRPFMVPPQSTEQILHPEKYYPEQEPPITVHLPAWESDGELKQVYRGVVGEWVTRLVLTLPQDYPQIVMFSTDIFVNEPIASDAAAGWGGDRIVTVASDDNSKWFIAWKSTWDTQVDASEFESAMARRVVSWDGFSSTNHQQEIGTDGSQHTWTSENGSAAWTMRKGQDVVVIVASGKEVLAQAKEWVSQPVEQKAPAQEATVPE